MARNNRSVGTSVAKKTLLTGAHMCGESESGSLLSSENSEGPPLASAAPAFLGSRSTEDFTTVSVPVIFHITYEGTITVEEKEEHAERVAYFLSESNNILAGEEYNMPYGFTGSSGLNTNLRLAAADRVAKDSLMPFIPRRAYSTHHYGDDFEGAFDGGVDIPGHSGSTTTTTKEDLIALRANYEAALETSPETRGVTEEEDLLRAAEEDYYFKLEYPGIIFYNAKTSLTHNYGGGSIEGKLGTIRDIESASYLQNNYTPTHFFQNPGNGVHLNFGINANINCINILSNSGSSVGGTAGDSGVGILVSNTYQNSFRVFSLKIPDTFKGFVITHELLHGLTMQHPWGYLTMKGERTSHRSADGSIGANTNRMGSAKTHDYTFDYDFIPPFQYNANGDSFENISSDEKIFIENIVNNYLPEYVQDSIYFSNGEFKGGVPYEVSELMATLPTFWGGSYMEVEGKKKFLINPTETLRGGSNSRTLHSVGDFVEGGILFQINEDGTGLVAAIEDLGSYEWGCYGTSITGADGTAIGTGYQNTLDIVAGCSETNTAASNALNSTTEGYTDWYLPSKDELVEMYNTIGNGSPDGNIGGFTNNRYWSSSESNSNSAWLVYVSNGYTSYYNKGRTNRVRVIRSVTFAPPTSTPIYQVGDILNGGTIISTSGDYLTAYVIYGLYTSTTLSVDDVTYRAPSMSYSTIMYGDDREGTYAAEYAAALASSAKYDELYLYAPELFEEGLVYGFHSQTGPWGYNPITQVLTSYPRLEAIYQGSWYDSDLEFVLKNEFVPIPQYTSEPTDIPANRKGPGINIYNPVCSFWDTTKLNFAFGLGLGWYDPRYPKFPEDTLVEDMFNQENCPCLYTEQSYFDTNSEGVQQEFLFTVKGSGGEDLKMDGFTRLKDSNIADDVANSDTTRDIEGSLSYLTDVFDSSKWFNTITNIPYEVKVPNFSVYTGFTKDSTIPYAIKGSKYILGGVDNISTGIIDNEGHPRGQGDSLQNTCNRYYLVGVTDSTSPLYNPFKITDDYVREVGSNFGGFTTPQSTTPASNTDLLALLFNERGISAADNLYGPIDWNYTQNIMHYLREFTKPKYISTSAVEKVNAMLQGNTGVLGRAIESANLIGLNSLVGKLDYTDSAMESVQGYIDDALDYLDAYDISSYELGCMNPDSLNYNPTATISGNCVDKVYGCMNPDAHNYNSGANVDDGSCIIYSLDSIPIYANYVCDEQELPVCNRYDSSSDITPDGSVAGISGPSPYLSTINPASLFNAGSAWSSSALAFILPYQYSCADNLLSSETIGPENTSGGCVNIADNSLCEYPSVQYFDCSVLEAGQGLNLLLGYQADEDYVLTCANGAATSRDIVSTSVGNFIIGSVLVENVLYTLLGISYKGKFIKDLDGTLYEYSLADGINRDNPLYFRNQLKVPVNNKTEKEAKNLMKLKASLDKIINFTN